MAEAAWFFGEDQARYLLACPQAKGAALIEAAKAAGVPATQIGKAEGDQVVLGRRPMALADVQAAHEGGFAKMMA